MDITLKRIANALIYHTNPKALLEADKKITAKLKASMPDQLDAKLKQERRELSTEELVTFVERLKTKDITMSIMTEMKRAAPELYQALVGERDVYMARGMDAIYHHLWLRYCPRHLYRVLYIMPILKIWLR